MRKFLNSAFTICLGLCLHAWQWKLLLKMIAMVHVMDDINFPIVINISTMMINWCIWRLPFRGLALPFNHSKLSNSTSSYLFKASSLQGSFTNKPSQFSYCSPKTLWIPTSRSLLTLLTLCAGLSHSCHSTLLWVDIPWPILFLSIWTSITLGGII